TDIIAAVVTRDPDWSALPKDTPPHIVRLLRRCLVKDPKLRLRDIGEARIALDSPTIESTPAPSAVRAAFPWWAAAAAILLAAAAFFAGTRLDRPAPAPFVRASIDLGPDAVAGGPQSAATFSPDGTRIVYHVHTQGAGQQQLAIRLLSESKTTLLTGTEGARDPFFSPDGQWIAFFTARGLSKVALSGGAAIPLCDVDNARGGAWLSDGRIVFAPRTVGGLMQVKDVGGTPQPLTDPARNGERTHRWPQELPGGRVLYTAQSGAAGFDDATLDVLDLKSGKSTTVLRGAYFARYVPSGHLLYDSHGSLYAVRFDLSRLATSGAPITIADDVAANVVSGGGQYDVSAAGAGMLAYL